MLTRAGAPRRLREVYEQGEMLAPQKLGWCRGPIELRRDGPEGPDAHYRHRTPAVGRSRAASGASASRQRSRTRARCPQAPTVSEAASASSARRIRAGTPNTKSTSASRGAPESHPGSEIGVLVPAERAVRRGGVIGTTVPLGPAQVEAVRAKGPARLAAESVVNSGSVSASAESGVTMYACSSRSRRRAADGTSRRAPTDDATRIPPCRPSGARGWPATPRAPPLGSSRATQHATGR